MDKVSSAYKGYFYMQQAHWQYDTQSVVRGEAALSCILEDEALSKVNSALLEKLQAGQFPAINLLELDNVCDMGNDILLELRSRPVSLASTTKPVQFPYVCGLFAIALITSVASLVVFFRRGQPVLLEPLLA